MCIGRPCSILMTFIRAGHHLQVQIKRRATVRGGRRGEREGGGGKKEMKKKNPSRFKISDLIYIT